MKKIIILLTAFLLPLGAFAQFIYVAKQDGTTVYLDITELKTAPKKGDTFKFIEKEESLKNIKGEDLGTVYSYGKEFTITEVQPKFAVGELKEKYNAKPGQKAILETAAPVPVAAAPIATTREEKKSVALFRSNAINEILLSARMVNFYGDGKKYLAALNDKNEVKIYSLEGNTFKEHAAHQLPSARKAFSLGAFDAKKTGKDQLFVVVQDTKNEEVSTIVLEDNNGAIKQSATLRWAVKDAFTPEGKKLYAQEIYKHNGIKTSPVRQLKYDGKFAIVKEKLPGPAEASVFAFLSFDLDKDKGTDSVLTTANGSLYYYPAEGKKIDFGSDISFAAAPKRILVGNTIYRILPPIAAIDYNGAPEIAAIENMPKIAILADSFASYKGSKLRLFKYNDMNFEEVKIIDLPAVAYDLSYEEFEGKKGYFMPLVYESGKTVLELY